MHRPLSLIVTLASFSSLAYAFQDTTAVVPRDSLSTTATRVDTTRMLFLPGMGSLRARIDSTDNLHNSQFVWTDAKYLGDLLWKMPGYYLRGLGEAGKLDQFTAFGLDGRSIPILLDGRPVNEPYSGITDLYSIPLEAIEQIEMMDAADAVMYGSQGVGINLVTRQYNNNRPITKLRYMQGPFEYGLTDGMFAQNILRGTNLSFGFQRHTTDGRFTNSAYDSWNIRSQLRYNVSDRLNIAASYFYYTADNGQNGGIHDTSASLFDEVEAIVRDSTALESTSRHDFSITGIARLFPDSASTTQFSLFSIEHDREFTDSISVFGATSLLGGRILQRLSTRTFNAALGIEFLSEESVGGILYQHGDRERSALFGKLELRLLEQLIPAFSFRTEVVEGRKGTLSYGLSLRARLGERAMLTSSYSVFSIPGRTKTLKYATLGLDFVLKNSTRLSISGYGRSSAHTPPYSIAVVDSNVTDVILFSEEGALGGSASLSTRLGSIESNLTATYTMFEHNGIATAAAPIFTATGEIAYRDVILKDVMELRAGVRVKHSSSSPRVIRYIPRYALYVENAVERSAETFTLDIFAVAHLGDAHLTLSFENILDEGYTTVYRYPMPGRTFRFGFNWTFFD